MMWVTTPGVRRCSMRTESPTLICPPSWYAIILKPNVRVQPAAGWRDACHARGVTAERGGCNALLGGGHCHFALADFSG